MIEKWRVIDESGATHEVDVTSDGSAHPLWTTRATYRGIEQKTFPTTTARRSVLRWAVASDVQPVEILAPGQPSRAEVEGVVFAQWLRDRADAVVNDDPAAASTLYLAAEQAPAGIVAPSWGPLPTAAEVEAHVARSSPARASDGAPWAYRCADSSGDYVAIIYLRAEEGEVTSCEPGHAVWYRLRAWHRKSQWRPVDADGVAVERGER